MLPGRSARRVQHGLGGVRAQGMSAQSDPRLPLPLLTAALPRGGRCCERQAGLGRGRTGRLGGTCGEGLRGGRGAGGLSRIQKVLPGGCGAMCCVVTVTCGLSGARAKQHVGACVCQE